MGHATTLKAERRHWRTLSLDEQADMAERHQVESLLFCPDGWAMSHSWVNEETGEVQRARCNRWECLYCGPRKVDLWRQLVKAAEPVLFLTLSKAGKTVEEAARALTTFVQALRRGSKGRGPNHVGARPAYPIEYFAVLERHRDFENVGFHWHLLIRGVDHIPYKEVIQPLWISATRGKLKGEEADEKEAKIAHIERIRNARAIGYVTKYLTKALGVGEKGERQVRQKRTVVARQVKAEMMVRRQMAGSHGTVFISQTLPYEYAVQQDEAGQVVIGEEVETVKRVSKAHRIRYSRHFFPECVADLRIRLFAGEEQATESAESEPDTPEEDENNERRPCWRLIERGQETEVDVETYKQRRYAELSVALEVEKAEDEHAYRKHRKQMAIQVAAEVRELKEVAYRHKRRERLLEVLEEMNEGRAFLSRRVINMWAYQRDERRRVG